MKRNEMFSNAAEVGFYKPGFYELWHVLNFSEDSLQCLFKLITLDFMNFAFYGFAGPLRVHKNRPGTLLLAKFNISNPNNPA